MSREVWEAVETKVREVRVKKTERRKKREKREEMGGERTKEKEKEKTKKDGSMKSSRRMGDLE